MATLSCTPPSAADSKLSDNVSDECITPNHVTPTAPSQTPSAATTCEPVESQEPEETHKPADELQGYDINTDTAAEPEAAAADTGDNDVGDECNTVTSASEETVAAGADNPETGQLPATDQLNSVDSSSSSDEEVDQTGTVVRRRRDATAFMDDTATDRLTRLKDNSLQDSDDNNSWNEDDDEYIGIVPMLCARCVKLFKRNWPYQRAKRFVVILNVIICICGCILVCVALWLHICQDELFYGVILLDNPTSPFIVLDRIPIALVAVAVILALMGFIGACGAATECVCFLVLHAGMSVLCIVTQIFVALLALGFKSKIHSSMSASLQFQLYSQYNTTADSSLNTTSLSYRITAVWDHIQQQLDCCGSAGPSDYHLSSWFNNTPDSDGMFVPASCCTANVRPYYCQFEAMAAIYDEINRTNIMHTRGCYDAILDWLSTYHTLLALLLFLIDLLLVADIISTLLLIKTTRRKQADYRWYDEER